MQTPTPVEQSPLSGDQPSFLYALIGCFIPIVGGILYLTEKDKTPLRARSAGRGALVGFGLQSLVVPLMFAAAVLIPVFSRASENSQRAQCQKQMQQLCLAAMTYAGNNNDNFPDISTAAAIHSLMESPYAQAGNNPEESCPTSHAPYIGNPAVSGKNRNDIPDPANTILFYELDNAHLEGCNVSYVDGHVKWYRNSEWVMMKVRDGLP